MPNHGNILGGGSVIISGPCFNDYKQVLCDFESSVENVSLEAIPLDSHRILCVVPPLSSVGRSSFHLQFIDEEDKMTESQRRTFFGGKHFKH